MARRAVVTATAFSAWRGQRVYPTHAHAILLSTLLTAVLANAVSMIINFYNTYLTRTRLMFDRALELRAQFAIE